MSKIFLFLWGSQLVSLLGSSLTAFGISLWVFETTQSPLLMTLTIFSKLMPSIYISFFAGQLVDRFSIKRVFLFADMALLSVILLMFAAYLNDWFSLWLLLPCLFLTGIFESVQSLAFQKSVAVFNKPQFYLRSQGVVTLVENAPMILAPFLGAIAYARFGLGGIFTFDIGSYIVAITAVVALRFPEQSLTRKAGWFSLDAARFIWSHPMLSRLQSFFALSNFFNGLMGGLLAAYVLTATDGDGKSLATVNSVMAIGSVFGSLFLIRGRLQGSMVTWITVGTIVAALSGRLGMAITSSVAVWAVLMAIRSFLVPVISGANQTLWLQHVEKPQMGAVFGARRVFGQGAYPFAVLLGGILSDSVSLQTLFMTAGGLEVALGIAGFLWIQRLPSPSTEERSAGNH